MIASPRTRMRERAMKKLGNICAALALAFMATTVWAANVTGTWSATVDSPNGSFPITFTFTQDGNTLTGSVQGPQGDPMPITNGKIDGDTFTFDVEFNGTVIHHECTVDGDQIKMTTKSDDPNFPGMSMTLKKAAAPEQPKGDSTQPKI
jgi:hypothetical protein